MSPRSDDYARLRLAARSASGSCALRLAPLARTRFAILAVTSLAACAEEEAALQDPGLHLGVRVQGGQLVRGPLPNEAGGPAVTAIERNEPIVARGEGDVGLKGRLEPGGIAVHVQLEGDPDHWVRPAGAFNDVDPDQLDWSVSLEFSPLIPDTSTTVKVLVQGTNEAGTPGPISSTIFQLEPDPPPSKLTFALYWDRPVDLDLHVVTPEGVDLNPKNINSFVPNPAGLDPPDAWRNGALFDFDSNQECRIDGRQIERVTFARVDPTPGTYKVFANLFSACGQDVVNFQVQIFRNAERQRMIFGSLYEFDARVQPKENEAPGLFVTEFQVE
jgi:hypothetical protein